MSRAIILLYFVFAVTFPLQVFGDSEVQVDGILHLNEGGYIQFPDNTWQNTASITGVTAGTGLSVSGGTGNVLISVDPILIQRRVTATCSAGSAIGSIDQSGGVHCETGLQGSPGATGAQGPKGDIGATGPQGLPGEGVFSGSFILLDSTTAPSGYTYTGKHLSTADSSLWMNKADMPTARFAFALVSVNNKIYAIGGSTSTGSSAFATNEEYDPATNTWSSKASMPTARWSLTAAVVNGKIYAIGGVNSSTLNTCEEYDPLTDTWTSRAPMFNPQMAAASAVVNNKIYVLGGTVTPYTREYDPATNTWTNKANMAVARWGVAAATVDNKIYVIGGTDGSSNVTVNQQYDPAADLWAAKANMPTARNYVAGAAANGRVYIIGGVGLGGVYLGINEEYDPVTDTWTRKADMYPRYYLSAAVANNKIYVVGGNNNGIYLKTNEEYTLADVQTFYVHRKN